MVDWKYAQIFIFKFTRNNIWFSEEWMNGFTPSFGKAMMHGCFVALEGMVNFGVGGIVGSLGNVGTKGKFPKSKEWWGKFIFGLEFTKPFKIGIDYIRKNI